jgi:hypothetical protein
MSPQTVTQIKLGTQKVELLKKKMEAVKANWISNEAGFR